MGFPFSQGTGTGYQANTVPTQTTLISVLFGAKFVHNKI
jgi:hypothetical protein